MKIMHVLAVLSAAVIMMWTTGCRSTTPPKPITTIKGDLKFTEEITATVTADQKLIMDGKKFEIADIPAQLVKKNVSQNITIFVYPESKMTRETLVELIKILVQSNYFVIVDAKSKYAGVPIPGRS